METLLNLFFIGILLFSMVMLHFNSFRDFEKFPYMETNGNIFSDIFNILYIVFLVSLIAVIILNS
jgi:hypothetical protein